MTDATLVPVDEEQLVDIAESKRRHILLSEYPITENGMGEKTPGRPTLYSIKLPTDDTVFCLENGLCEINVYVLCQ